MSLMVRVCWVAQFVLARSQGRGGKAQLRLVWDRAQGTCWGACRAGSPQEIRAVSQRHPTEPVWAGLLGHAQARWTKGKHPADFVMENDRHVPGLKNKMFRSPSGAA